MASRTEAIDWLATNVESILPGAGNKEIIKKRLTEMSKERFAEFVQNVKEGKEYIHFLCPNGQEEKISIERNLEIGKKLGIPIYERVWTYNPLTGRRNMGPIPRLVCDIPARRLVQMQEYKLSVAKNNRHIDQRTNQPTGASKASAISAPEINLLRAQNYEATVREFVKDRGGDMAAFNLMENLIIRDGSVDQETLDRLNTRSKAPEVASTILTAMHIGNNV